MVQYAQWNVDGSFKIKEQLPQDAKYPSAAPNTGSVLYLIWRTPQGLFTWGRGPYRAPSTQNLGSRGYTHGNAGALSNVSHYFFRVWYHIRFIIARTSSALTSTANSADFSHAPKDDQSSQKGVLCHHAALPLRALLALESSIAEELYTAINLLFCATSSIDRHAIPHHDSHSPGRHPQFMFMCLRKRYVVESASNNTSLHFYPDYYASQFFMAAVSRKGFPRLLDAKAWPG